MSDQFVSLKDLACDIGMDRSHARRYVLKLGLRPEKRRTADSGGQLTLTLTQDEAEFVRTKRKEDGFLNSLKPVQSDIGVFYVVQLIPELDPTRIKLGFADDAAARLNQHRTSAPTAQIIKTWPSRRSWENTAIDCLTAVGCKVIMNEVYECNDLEALLRTGDAFFELLPEPGSRPELSDHSPHNT